MERGELVEIGQHKIRKVGEKVHGEICSQYPTRRA